MNIKISEFLNDLLTATQSFKMDFDCFSKGQLQSKEWLIEKLEKLNFELGTVFILCGWYSILSSMLFHSNLLVDKIRSFDIDKECLEVADAINQTYYQNNWRFKAITDDIFNIDFNSHTWSTWSKVNERMCYPISDIPDTIINTSCEHINRSWFDKIPGNKLIILQSTNFWSGKGHINCVDDLDMFKEMYKLKNIYYEGQLKLTKYCRFMLIGET